MSMDRQTYQKVLETLATEIVDKNGTECTHNYTRAVGEVVERWFKFKQGEFVIEMLKKYPCYNRASDSEVAQRYAMPPMLRSERVWQKAAAIITMEKDLDEQAVLIAQARTLPTVYRIREIGYNWGLLRRCDIDIDFPTEHDKPADWSSLTEALAAAYRLMKEYNSYDLDPTFVVVGFDQAGNILSRQEIESERKKAI